jgi:hypothetical protein
MMFEDLGADIVELAPAPAASPAAPLGEMAFRADAWSPEETERLRRLFSLDLSLEEIAGQLDRGRAGVADRVCVLGLRRNCARPWNALEDELLLQRYGREPAATLALQLGRSCSSVYVRAAKLGLTEEGAPAYTPWEDAQIRAGYGRGVPSDQIAFLIGRSECSVRSRACLLGVRSIHADENWSQEELDALLDLAKEGHRYLEIIERMVAAGFPRRTKAGLGPKLRQIGYRRGWGRRWTADEDDLLRHCYATGASLTPLRKGMGRTTCSLRWRARELGLQGTHVMTAGFRQGPVWTPADDAKLRELYGKVPTRELPALLGRPRGGIFCRANALGLKHGYWRPYTEDELRAYRLAFDHGLAIADLAIALEREAFTVSKYATDKLDLRFGRRPRRKIPLTLAEILALGTAPEAPAPRRTRGRPRAAAPAAASIELPAPAPAPAKAALPSRGRRERPLTRVERVLARRIRPRFRGARP